MIHGIIIGIVASILSYCIGFKIGVDSIEEQYDLYPKFLDLPDQVNQEVFEE